MEYCIDTAKATGAIIAAAPSISIIKIDRNSTIRLLKKSDITSLNDEEILALTGLLSVEGTEGGCVLIEQLILINRCRSDSDAPKLGT
jgi:sugar/nucleoside kinase (ribokinase family)